MRILIQMIDPGSIKGRRPPLDTVDFIAFLEKKFGKIGTILACYAGDKGFFHI
jgi:hypothetical protein